MALQGSKSQTVAARWPVVSFALAMAAIACYTSESRLFVSMGSSQFSGRGSISPVVAATLVQPTASPKSTGFPAALAVVAALALVKPRRAQRSSKIVAESRVTMHARFPYPTVPTGDSKNARRIRAGRKRSILNGRQIAVRVNPRTNKPIRFRMHVQPGDIVHVMKGKDAGKVTEVLRVFPKYNKILCLGVNYCIKHVRPQREDEVGQRVQVEAPMHSSCVMHYDPEEKIAGHLGIRFQKKTRKDGKELVKKVRYNKATGNAIPVRLAKKWLPVLDREAEDEDE